MFNRESMLRAASSFLRNPVNLLVMFQAILLYFIGVYWSEISPLDIALVLAGAIGTEFFLAKKVYFPGSTIAAALGIGIFFRAVHPALFLVAGCIAVLSKYLIRTSRGHIFNPSNIAILSLAFLFPSAATIEFTQWGSSIFEYALVAAVAFAIAYRAGVITTTLSFFGGYLVLLLALLPWYPDALSFHHYGLIGPSLVLFASFMITDPKTSPTRRGERVLHGLAVAVFFFSLEIIGVRYAIFVASFVVTIANLLSRSMPMILRRFFPVHFTNTPTLVIAFALLLAAIVAQPPKGAAFDPAKISPDFLVRGVESAGLLRCDPAAPLQRSQTALFEEGTPTFGAAWGDYDLDGYDDLYISNASGGPSRLYRNNGDGSFTDVTEASGLPELSSWSAVFADYDNDRRLDLFIVPTSPWLGDTGETSVDEVLRPIQSLRAYRNMGGGRFEERTGTLGLEAVMLPSHTGGALSFGDYDRDGDLDFVFVSGGSVFPAARSKVALLKSLFDPRFDAAMRLVCAESDIRDVLQTIDRRATGARSVADALIHAGACLVVNDSLALFTFTNSAPRTGGIIDALWLLPGSMHLFENTGVAFKENGGFEERALSGVQGYDYEVRHLTRPFSGVSRHYFQPISFDYDRDGLQDIFVTVGWGRNMLLRNRGDMKFEDVTASMGLDYGGSGMGVALADHNMDGYADIVITNVFVDYLFISKMSPGFNLSDAYIGAQGLGWGVASLDYDLDGQEDIFVVNGDVARTIIYPDRTLGRSLFRSDRLYRNLGHGRFEDVTGTGVCTDAQSGRAVAVSDFDNNGTPDLFVGNPSLSGTSANTDVLYVNRTSGNSFLKVQLQGSRSNTFGVGAAVSVTSGSGTQTKIVTIGDSFYSSNSTRLIFGLGALRDPVDIRVVWPSGVETTMVGVPVDQEIAIKER